MSTYIFGDIQGCFDSLQALLDKLKYDPARDQLGFVGDLVNRGPQSLETLRFIKSLNNPIVVLGNHDLHLLALGYEIIERKESHQLKQVTSANDAPELLDWLRKQPVTYLHQPTNTLLVHAGVPPQWSIDEAVQYGEEVHAALSSTNFKEFLAQMYGKEPRVWNPNLSRWDRLRYIVNAFTRVRFCSATGELDLDNTTNQSSQPNIFKPWFEWRKGDKASIAFGHWASLEGRCPFKGFYALDTGCVWGGRLTALELETGRLISCS